MPKRHRQTIGRKGLGGIVGVDREQQQGRVATIKGLKDLERIYYIYSTYPIYYISTQWDNEDRVGLSDRDRTLDR